MKSRITMEIDFNTGGPYIRVINNTVSDDVRDKLVSFFRQKLGYTSSWCKIIFADHVQSEDITFEIRPIEPEELANEGKIMLEQSELNKEYGKKVHVIYTEKNIEI